VDGTDCILVILLGGADWPTGPGPATAWAGSVPGAPAPVPMRAAAYDLEGTTKLDLGETETEVGIAAVCLTGLGGIRAFPGELGCDVSAIYDMISETLFQATSETKLTHLEDGLDSPRGVGFS
jgi:hypothetical protein